MWKNFFFDYFYYRLYQLNANKGDYQGFPAVAVISLVQGLVLGGFIAILTRTLYNRNETATYSKLFANIGIVIFISLLIYNYRKYMGKHGEFIQRWGNERLDDKTIKGYMMVLAIILSFAPLLIIGIFF